MIHRDSNELKPRMDTDSHGLGMGAAKFQQAPWNVVRAQSPIALTASERCSLSSTKWRRGLGRGGAYDNCPSLRLSPRSCLTGRKRKTVATDHRAEPFHPCPSVSIRG